MSIFPTKPVRDFSRVNNSAAKVRFTYHELRAFDHHGWRCHYCNSDGPLHADHVTPQCEGGDSTWSNLVPSCRSCNSAKGKKPYDAFREIIAADLAAYHTFLEFGDCV